MVALTVASYVPGRRVRGWASACGDRDDAVVVVALAAGRVMRGARQ
jgi:hypothetical protein